MEVIISLTASKREASAAAPLAPFLLPLDNLDDAAEEPAAGLGAEASALMRRDCRRLPDGGGSATGFLAATLVVALLWCGVVWCRVVSLCVWVSRWQAGWDATYGCARWGWGKGRTLRRVRQMKSYHIHAPHGVDRLLALLGRLGIAGARGSGLLVLRLVAAPVVQAGRPRRGGLGLLALVLPAALADHG